MKLAFVVQRYGTEILGGSEYHCRLIAERMAQRHQVEVLTTCARDYITWANEYPAGADRVRGVTVRRFPNARTRDIDSFNRFSDWIFGNPHSVGDEMEWLQQQGPWCPALVDHLQAGQGSYDALIFFTYLYAPTVLGLHVAPGKSILVPTAHDEAAIGLSIYRDVFALPAGIAYNTAAERRFLTTRFSIRATAAETVGCGVDLPQHHAYPRVPRASRADRPEPGGEAPAPMEDAAGAHGQRSHITGRGATFRRRHRLHRPFLLYGGRIEKGKGCEELIEYFNTYVSEGGEASLVLMGVKLMPLPEDPAIKFAGLLSEVERAQALEAASVVVVPSPYESLSLLALEAFSVGTPVLASARSEVLVDHCTQSNAGLFYADRWEFVEALNLLMRDERLRAAMGRNGRDYVRQHYRWDVILAKYERMIGRIRA
ncbi:MAG TPA: glycosyltransferase family 4 protein [Vicinamibacterales bacterium]|nr:glycosyltransferase family 4 protein [Vicinamibacterales bacterium]